MLHAAAACNILWRASKKPADRYAVVARSEENRMSLGSMLLAVGRILPPRIRRLSTVQSLKSRIFHHDTIYDQKYFATQVEASAVRASAPISESIVSEFRPSAVLDVGCGTGALLEAIRQRGCAVKGLEYAEAALAYCRARGLDVDKFDIESDVLSEIAGFDVVVSMEVGEHLPESCADRYVALLTDAAPTVVFTAARPGQGGTDHINEQSAAYWHSKFASRGFEWNSKLSAAWRADWERSGEVPPWYHSNLMIFRRISPHS